MNKDTPLDWLALNDKAEDAFHHLKQLLQKGGTEIEVRPRAEEEHELWAAYWEQRASQRLRGQQLLFFQYPYFQSKRAGTKTLEPLLRWPCFLTPPIKGTTEWRIKILQSTATEPSNALPAKAEYNKAWVHWASKESDVNWAQLLRNCLQADEQSLKNLSVLAQTMMEQTTWQSTTVQPALTALSSIAYQEEEKNELLWLAGIGVSTDQWVVIPPATTNWQAPLTEKKHLLERLNLLKFDPSQYRTLKTAAQNSFSVVNGESSSGKTHTLIEAVKAQLLSQKPCLIVARNKSIVKHIQNCLKKERLDQFAFHWQNEATDLTIFQAKIRAATKLSATLNTNDYKQWKATIGRLNRSHRSLIELFDAARKPLLDSSWSEILGQYLKNARKEGKELLASQLTPAFFQFTNTELEAIKAAIDKTRPLYNQMETVHHPLSNLNAAIFVHQGLEESAVFIERNATSFSQTANHLRQQYLRRQSQYTDQLAAFYEKHYTQLREKLRQLEALLEDGQNEFGKDTLDAGHNTLRLYSQFSKRFKKAVQHKEKIQEAYQEMQSLHEELSAFNFSWPDVKPSKITTALEVVTKEYEESLQNWRTGLSESIQNECLRLNHKTAHTALKVSTKILPLEEAFEQFIDELNASGLYQLPLHSKTLTLNRQQKYLEDIIAQLEQTRNGLQAYDTFYHWQCNWFSLEESSRKVIQALLRSQPKDWQAAFSSWYLNECLNQHYHPFPTIKPGAITDFVEKTNEVRAHLPELIHKKWEKAQHSAMNQLKKITKTDLFDVNELLLKGGTHLAAFYPVALASPEMALQLAPYYKTVFVDDAQSVSAQSILPAVEHCEQMLVFVNPKEDTFLESSCAQFLKENAAPVYDLNGRYQLTFAQQLLAMEKNVQFHQLDGRFNEADQSNEVEALACLKILNTIQKTPQHTYPSVGIITLTSGQRDKIQSLFYRIKKDRLNGVEILQQLERNGLKVLTADEMSGQQFDHLIISTVHAPIDIKGHLSPMLNALNDGVQKASLWAIEKGAKVNGKWDVLCSMPVAELEERLNWSDKEGEQKFAQLLLFIHHVSHGNMDKAYTLSQCWQPKQLERANDSLSEELIDRLQVQLPNWSFFNNQASGIDHTVLQGVAPNQLKVAILADGFVSTEIATTLDWEQQQQQRLSLSDYHTVSFSTEGLWKDPSHTCLRLAEQLSALADKSPENLGV